MYSDLPNYPLWKDENNVIWREKAIEQIKQVFPAQANELIDHIRAAASSEGSESIFRRIAHANDAEQIMDYFAEIRFGLMFAHLRFETAFEPFGERGPDLSISRDGQRAYVEVRRFRSEDRAEEIGDELEAYGNSSKDIKRIIDRIIEKFKQLECGNGIVALWNDHDDWELEFEFAMNDIRVESSNGIRQLPATLLFSVFGSASLYVRRRQRFYAEPFQQLSEPYVTWVEALKKL